MKLRIARNGKVLGEWTKTELYSLLRASEVFPSDYYWHEGMNEWKRLAELRSDKSVLATPAQRQKLRIARNGKVLGEWTKTEPYSLLRASEVFPSDYYCHEGMNEWRRLAELPSGKSVVAAPAQRQMLTDHGLPWDEFTTKYQASKLMESRPCTENQQLFMDDL